MFSLRYNISLSIFVGFIFIFFSLPLFAQESPCFIKIAATKTHNTSFSLDFFCKNNLTYAKWINKAMGYEKTKLSQNFEKSKIIYEYLIQDKNASTILITRLRLARLYIQYQKLDNHYQKALAELAILETTKDPSFLIFTYYMHAIIYAHGYGVRQNKNRALSYYEKYKLLIVNEEAKSKEHKKLSIRVSIFLYDISLTSPKRLKEIIDATPIQKVKIDS